MKADEERLHCAELEAKERSMKAEEVISLNYFRYLRERLKAEKERLAPNFNFDPEIGGGGDDSSIPLVPWEQWRQTAALGEAQRDGHLPQSFEELLGRNSVHGEIVDSQQTTISHDPASSKKTVLGPLTNLDVPKSFDMKRKRQDDKEEGVDDDEEH